MADYGKWTVTMDEVLDKLSIPQSGKNNFYITCPCCANSEKEKKLNVNIAKNVFRCAKCDTGGGPINLYSFFKTGSASPTAEECKEYVKEIKGVSSFKEADKVVFKRPKPKKIKVIDHEPTSLIKRSETYSLMMRGIGLNVKHYNDLISRGLRREDILNNGYRSVPDISGESMSSFLRTRGHDLIGVPGFFKNDKGLWTLATQTSGYFIPVRSLEGKLERGKGYVEGLQIRSDNPDDSKYKWLSSRDMLDGSGACTWAHFCGYPEEEVLLTEGPLKADIIYRFTKMPVIAIPGVNAIAHLDRLLDLLKKYKTKTIKVAFDMDLYTNPFVEKALNKLIKTLHEKGFETKVLKWDVNYKGYDDFLLYKFKELGGKLDDKMEDHGQNALL